MKRIIAEGERISAEVRVLVRGRGRDVTKLRDHATNRPGLGSFPANRQVRGAKAQKLASHRYRLSSSSL